MAFDRAERIQMLGERAAGYVEAALSGISREYPVMPLFIAAEPGPYRTHREQHPAFYGCFDWHSCVEMHWVLARLLRLFPDRIDNQRARAALARSLTVANLQAELSFFQKPHHRAIERPYGWGWLFTLQHELEIWDDPDAGRFTAAVEPLATFLMEQMLQWLPKLTYAVRVGIHSNSAFALSRSFDFAQLLRVQKGDDRFSNTILAAANRWFAKDTEYPAHYEPSGTDFLSPALCEAELMSQLLSSEELSKWLGRFLPGLANSDVFEPAKVSDPSNGHIAHLHGLNLSRAWSLTRLADRLPRGDSRIEPLLLAAERHAAESLSAATGSDYAVEHWLAAYAVLLLS